MQKTPHYYNTIIIEYRHVLLNSGNREKDNRV